MVNEYLTKCSKCGKHNILSAVKAIKINKRLPQRVNKCNKCGKTSRMTLIGEVIKNASNTSVGAEFSTHNRLVFKLF